MKNFKKLFSVVLIAGSFIIMQGCKGDVKDDKVLENVQAQLALDQAFKGVMAEVKDGVVTLSGTCDGDDCAKLAENKVSEAEGVKSIENNIKNDHETDLTLRTSVQSIISKYEGVQAHVAGGIIVLRGSIVRNQVQP